ncbi:BTAD domain-containing putative transcriptional regulator [Streptomyces noursei]|uniref:AfsR/SARP family transcriptional regulator n=1 Tax=Streptomyces noursei TaxID=1971 RepID=UPI0036A011ED
MQLRFRVLGPLEVCGQSVLGTSPIRHAILTALLLRPGQPIGVGEFAELLWDEPPASAAANIRSHVTTLRQELDGIELGLSHQLRTFRGTQRGYGLQAAPGDFDLPMFVEAARRGRSRLQDNALEAAIGSLEEAAALWRGPFGQALPPTHWFNAHVAGLNNARFDALQDLFTALVLARRTDMLAYRIERAIAEAPYRQRLWELLTAVHCVNGDAVNALEAIKRCQELFAVDLGLDLPPSIEAMRVAALNWSPDQALQLVAAQVRTTDASASPSGS